MPAGGRICAISSECPALRALKEESTWKSSFACTQQSALDHGNHSGSSKPCCQSPELLSGVPHRPCQGRCCQHRRAPGMADDACGRHQYTVGRRRAHQSSMRTPRAPHRSSLFSDRQPRHTSDIVNSAQMGRSRGSLAYFVADFSDLGVDFWLNRFAPVHASEFASKCGMQRDNLEAKLRCFVRSRDLTLDR